MAQESIAGFRLSPQQKHVWLLQHDQCQPYRAQCAIAISGALDPALLAQTLGSIVARHEILRTTFRCLPGMTIPIQVIAEAGDPLIAEYDLSGQQPHEHAAALDALFAELRQQPFNLAHGPLLRLALVTFAADRQVLLVSLPALCADAATLTHLARAIAHGYAAGAQGVADDEPMQYADAAEIFNELLESADTEAGRAYWREHDCAELLTLKLPFEQSPAEPAHFTPQSLALPIAPASAAGIAELAARWNMPIASLLLACWQTLLWRLSGQPDVLVGVGHDGRTYAELEEAYGLYARYLPLVCRLDPRLRLRELVERVQAISREVAEWQDAFSWEQLRGSDTSVPFFPVCFDFTVDQPSAQMIEQAEEAAPAFALERREVHTDRFKLRLACVQRPSELAITLHYDATLFAQADLARMTGQFAQLLTSVVADPAAAISAFDILSAAERQQVLVAFNQTQIAYSDSCAHELFAAQAERTPDAVAVVGDGSAFSLQLTYAELDRRANQLAQHLRGLGVGPDVLVALAPPRAPELIVGILGVLKAGGAYLPLDLTYPAERLTFMLNDSQARVIITDSIYDLRFTIDDLGASDSSIVNRKSKIVNLRADWPLIAQQPATAPDSGARAANLAYVIYTSGSTGVPKGVLIAHQGLSNYLHWCTAAYAVAEGRGALLHSPIGFDLTVTSLFAPLLTGQPVRLLAEGRDIEALRAALLTERDLSLVKLTPAHLEALGQLLPAAEVAGRVRALIVGGEALLPEHVAFWRTHAPDTRIINEYGPTETVVGCCVYEIPADATLSGAVPIGQPIANTQLYLLDVHMQPTPIGVPGELFIGGAGVARGYLNRPELTAERFVPNPFAEVSGAGYRVSGVGISDTRYPTPDTRLYKTGDLARYRPDGNLEFLGRIDDQVKLRGYRVELGEIAAVLAQHPAVQDAIAVIREEQPSAGEQADQRLVAYIVPDPQRAFTVRQLMRFEREGQFAERQRVELPSGMVIAQHNKNETDYLYQDIFEAQVYQQHGITLPDGACIFDVGANIGMFTLYAGQVCRNAVIYAFEPIPAIFDVLRMNAALYGLNAKLFNYGIANAPAITTFTYYTQLSLMSGRFTDDAEDREVVKFFELNQRNVDAGDLALGQADLFDELLAERLAGEPIVCELKTLSQVLREQGVAQIDLLKIDVEKSEEDVLAGIEADDWPKIRQLVIEVYDKDGRLERIRALLERRGYAVVVEADALLVDTGLYNVYAIRPALAALHTNGSTPIQRVEPAWTSQQRLLSDIERFVRDRLPDYMVPAAFVLLDTLPLTANGKVDRRALPAPERTRPTPERSHHAPRTPAEELVAGIWAQVLGIENIGTNDNFFALGGHSLLATRVGARIREAFQVELPLRVLFETPTIAGLAQWITAAQRATPGTAIPPLRPTPRDGALPLSFAQQRLWFLDQLAPGSPFYNVPAALRFKGRLHVAALAQCLATIVQRHEALRTTFATLDGRPVQLIAPFAAIDLPLLDLRALPTSACETAALQLIRADARQSFDLARGPLLRVALLRLDEAEHVLLLNMHHIVADGWSIAVFTREAAALYAAFAAGRPAALPELPIQYADYAAWQHKWLLAADADQPSPLQAQLAYWRRALAGAPTSLELPTDRPRPPIQTFNGALQSFRLAPTHAQALGALSRREGLTLFMTLLAAFDVLLYRYTGQDDLLIGSPIAGRSMIETEALIGCFVNTLVLRADLSGNPRFRELARRTREVTLAAYAHQDLPFEQLVEALQPQRDLSRHPLFQVQFVLQNARPPALELPDLSLQPLEIGSGTAKFDLTLFMRESAQGLVGTLEYNTDLFADTTISRMLGHIKTLLEAIAADPTQRLAELPLLTATERRQLLVDWNATAAPYPQEACVHDLFADQARRTPDAVALVFNGTKDERRRTKEELSGFVLRPSSFVVHVTYAELNARANRLAHHLRGLGVGPDVRVAIDMPRSLELVIALLGVLKAGGAYLPLDPSYPAERLAFMLDDSQAAVLITATAVVETARRAVSTTAIIDLPADWPLIAQQPATAPDSGVRAANLAYVIYTSGSTGRPKGVMIAHQGLVNYLHWCIAAYAVAAGRGAPLHSPIGFDLTVTSLFAPLLTGQPVALLAEEPGGAALGATLDSEGDFSLVKLTPTHLALLEQTPSAALAGGWARTLIVGGEALLAEHVAFWRTHAPAMRIINEYGPTETVVGCCVYELPADATLSGAVPIGRPIANTQLYLLDAHMQPVPIGVPGELFIGGAGVARGYLGRPDLTAERFVPNPFAEVPGIGYRVLGAEPSDTRYPIPDTRLYKTGDLARYRPDGNLEFLGRIDDQIKLRGYRVELGEITATLAQHPSVRECAVVARAADTGEARLVAYVVEGSGIRDQGSVEAPLKHLTPVRADRDPPRPLIPELRAFLAARLPDYMLPTAFVLLDALPLTPNGKIDQRALPAPADMPRTSESFAAAPRTPTEELLAGIWGALLGRDVGIHDNFFALGGHSLLATQVIARVREAFQIELPLRSLFEAPTVAGLAERITATQRAGADAPPSLRPLPRDGALPLSFAQQRLWFLDQLAPGSPIYNMPVAVRLTGSLDLAALAGCLNGLIARHEPLRTSFAAVDGQPAQIIAAAQTIALPLLDLQALAQDRELFALDMARVAARDPFDLARGPLLRTALLRLQPDEHILLLTMHHITADGWSMGVIIRDIAALYAASLSGQPAQLPALPIQYADYAIWQRNWLQGAVLDAQLTYWRDQLAELPILHLPLDRPRPAVSSFSGAGQRVALDPASSTGLLALSRREGVTLFMMLLAAFHVLLARYSGQHDIVVGTDIANRNQAATEGLIGFFINQLVLRADLASATSFRELLSRVREVTLDAYAHQDLPFEQLVAQLQPGRDLNRAPLFQVKLVLQNTPLRQLVLPQLRWDALPVEHHAAQFDLLLLLRESATGIGGTLEYSTDLFDAATISRMLGHFATLLAGIVADPARRPSELPLLTRAERWQLLGEWNDTRRADPDAHELHDLIADQAARAPDAVALVTAEQHLTYQALDARANQLAHYLQQFGVGPELLVALCLERSLDMILALLAVRKAGGAYLPLDPAAPSARLAHILEASAAPLLLTSTALLDRLPATWALVLDLEADAAQFADAPTTPPFVSSMPDQLAYALFTSGSTGAPKGVLLAQRGLSNLLRAQSRLLPVTSASRVLQFAALSFDAALSEIGTALTMGATLVLAPPTLLTGDALHALLDQQRISVVTLPPTALALLPPDPLPALRTLLVAGEACPPALVARWAPGRRLVNGYGPTETTIGAVMGAGTAANGALPLGRTLANMQVYLLDDALQPVPIGVAGELFIGGVQLARGYLNRADLTAERFVPNPFVEVSGAGYQVSGAEPSDTRYPTPDTRLYKTGDRARYQPDGQLVFMGRRDGQVKLRGFRIELGEVEAVLGQHPAVRACAVRVREDRPGDKRLVAYVVTTDDEGRMTKEIVPVETQYIASLPRPSSFVQELRDHLEQRLPNYMLPAAFVFLAALPLNPHGKIDYAALPAPDSARPALAAAFVAPRTPTEAVLAGIWREVLGLNEIGAHDNFFTLGGDSILSIQLIARARQAGLDLAPRQIFQHPTLAGLAAVARTGSTPAAEQGLITGHVPLTPIQHWFFAQRRPQPQHYNQALLLELRRPLSPALLAQALQLLLTQHDALRLRFVAEPTGWRQTNARMESQPVVARIDLASLPEAMQTLAITTIAGALQASLNLAEGPLLRAAAFDRGAGQTARLLIIIHHLAVDGVSWRVLLEDLQTACEQLQQGQPVRLPPKTTAFQQWAERLGEYAQSDALREQAGYWLAQIRHGTPRLPTDLPAGDNSLASARTLTVTLNVEETDALLREVPEVYHTQINDLLLTALAIAIAEWTGSPTLRLDLEGHGREALFDDLDLSRTVGWFTALFPVLLELPADAGLGAAIKTIKEQLRQVPQRGIGYGLLRYLRRDDELVHQLRALPPPELSFNYLGQVDQTLPTTGLFGLAHEASGPTQSTHGQRSHLLEINSVIVGGQLELTWTYSAQLHRRATIARLAGQYLQALRALIAHCRAPDAGGYTPSDFPLARVDQATLDRALGDQRRIDDLYPLGPMQQGILFHTLYAPDSGVYIEQLRCTIRGDLDVTAFQRAWQAVMDRHTVLRTAFVWKDIATPVQIVHPPLRPSWTRHDWRTLDRAAQASQLADYLAADRARGFVVSQPPLLRFALFQLADDAYQFVWSHHHLLLDGWSVPIVLIEVFAHYTAFARGLSIQLEHPQPYRDYIAWLQRQDLAQAEAFWRRTLTDFSAPTPLAADRSVAQDAGAAERSAEQRIRLSEGESAVLQTLAQQHGLTINTLVQGAWALLLGRYSGESDVVFGATVAGRPADLPGVERMVGLFINTLPVRVRVTSTATLLDWLAQLQAQQVEARQYEYTPLVQVQSWSEVPRGQPLFESVVVFENYPVDAALREGVQELVITDVQIDEQTNYPLIVVAAPGATLALQLNYDEQRFDAATVARMLGHLRTLLVGIAADPARRITTLPLLTDAEWHELVVARNASAQPYPRDAAYAQLFAAQVARTPDAIAAVCADAQLSYQALAQRAELLARFLQQRGIARGDRVGICLDRSFEMLVGLFGIFQTGAAFVPIDPAFPPERRDFILQDAQVKLLITTSIYDLRFTIYDRDDSDAAIVNRTSKIVNLDAEWANIVREGASAPPCCVPVGGSDLAYLIYTSGSTGTPKGVLIPHSGLLNYLIWCLDAYTVREGRGAPVHASIAADAIFPSLFAPLLVGTSVVLIPEPQPLDTLAALLQTVGHFSTIKITPSQLEVLNQLLPASAARDAVRTLVVGAEAVHGEVLQFWQSNAPETIILDEYGPTETVVGCSSYRVTKPIAGAVPIGLPSANMQFYVLDRHMQVVPLGVVGELYIGGDGVAWGYQGRPALTAERFVPNPFAKVSGIGSQVSEETAPNTRYPTPGTRLYKTGDLVRYLDERAANIVFLGRADDQVKLRGYRVEPGEVTAVLGSHPAVREAVVLARADDSGHKRLVAYVVPADDERRMTNEFASVETQYSASVRRPSSFTQELREQPELWPSIGEYFLYDEFIYHVLTHDDRRQASYRRALEQTVRDKVALDIGTGADAILARMCVAAGARRVYAIELLDNAYEQAQRCIERLGLTDRITLIHGDALTTTLPELVDVCVSQIAGVIGGAEGAGTILNDARRFLKPGGRMIPERSITKIAAIQLPDALGAHPHFAKVPQQYAEQTFERVGRRFDLRVCIKNFPRSHVYSTIDIFEDLDFRSVTEPAYRRDIRLTITESGRIDGFLVWLNLHVSAGIELDVLEDEYAWLPVYFPVFCPGVAVAVGDVIEATCSAALGDNGFNPDYQIAGRLLRQDGQTVAFSYESSYAGAHYRANAFYDALFGEQAAPPPAEPQQARFISALREHIKARLPEYMVPSAFVLLDAMPLAPHGKIDRKALPAPDQSRPALEEAFVSPRSTAEETLAGIWREVLGLAQVGVNDNFFALGGDSILSIQVIAKAHQAGLNLMPRQIFQHPTIAALAEVTQTAPTITAEQGLVRGPVPLTPIQLRFFAQALPDPQHYNQALLLTVREPLDPAALVRAVRQLLRHHDALRLRFVQSDSGWQQRNEGTTAQPITALVNLAALPSHTQTNTITAVATAAQTSLNLATGPLMRVVYFMLGPDQPARLLLIVHHLAVDGVSWRVLLEDVQTAYRQSVQGQPVRLPPKSSAFQQWAGRLAEYAQSAVLREELAYWLAPARRSIRRLPVDHSAGSNRIADADTVTVVLDAETTEALLHMVPEVYHTQINDVLLAALALACAEWTGSPTLLLDLEGHGREALFDDLDVSRTAGWFTTLFPVLIELPSLEPGAALKAVKEQLYQVPQRGIGYGLLRYLCRDDELVSQLRALPPAELIFNYLGQVDQTLPTTGLFGLAREASGPPQNPAGQRSHLLEINGLVVGGQLELAWAFSTQVHERATIVWLAEQYMQALRALISHCLSPDAGGFTPSDFPEMRFSQAELDDLIGELSESLEDEG